MDDYSGPDSTQKQRGRAARTTAIGRGLTIPNDPPRNGVLSSDPWQKIRKTAVNVYPGKFNCAFDVFIPRLAECGETFA